MSALKLRAIGNSVGVVLPKEVLARLRVGEGDNLYAVETPEGVILTPLDIMHRYRNTLAALAK
jgi:putative addiction module antidote